MKRETCSCGIAHCLELKKGRLMYVNQETRYINQSIDKCINERMHGLAFRDHKVYEKCKIVDENIFWDNMRNVYRQHFINFLNKQ